LYLCTDSSRGTYRFMGNDGEIVKDTGAIKLTKAIYKPIKDKTNQITTSIDCDNIDSDKCLAIMSLDNDNTEFRSRLSEKLQS